MLSRESDAVNSMDECFQKLIEECKTLRPNSRLSCNLRNRLEKFPIDCRAQIVNRVKVGCSPLFIACKKGQIDIVDYLVSTCNADIELKGIYEVPDDRSTHAVTPLWCAAVSGKLAVVKFLVSEGANVNAVSDTGSTPVRSACFMTHLEIVRYLVENGADINRPNFNGGTCLINSVQSVHLCEFLLKHGANVNAQDIQCKTALHYAIQEHRLETSELLISTGANYDAKSKYGDDALQTACLKGAIVIFEHLTNSIPYTDERLADAHELLGTTFLDEHNDIHTAISHWRTAQGIRDKNGMVKRPTVTPRAAFRYQKEFTTREELENILGDFDSIRIQSLLISERILGCHHKDTVFRLMFRGASYADMLRYQRCIDLWRRALEIRVEKDTILYSDTCFTAQALVKFMVDYNEKCALEEKACPQRFKDSVCTFVTLTQNLQDSRELLLVRPQSKRQMENFDKILKCITHLIYLMLQTAKSDYQKSVVSDLVCKLIALNPTSVNTDDSLLHLCVSKLNSIKSGYSLDENPNSMPRIFPNESVISFLLECGAHVNARNDSRSTPLHVATVPYNRNDWLVGTLLKYGAHIDLPNASGECPVDKVNRSPLYLNIQLVKYVSLKCLCATAICKLGISYSHVPKALESFVQMHQK